ncbi:sodium-dependent proline transporter-like isoform X3 [Lingula anatina]|uniref:Transporter n=1 Tax=Lingula anatina TaxID=7574 RepID=A0A1S3HJ94_LINAN|nr:sodium-dependent proline transporter-like isoform X3 [Lingula anatina]|eukprot:XP_013386200.1 sodium-dependent proline transporter-like isoform X3 [Lingula anatina]
MLDPIVGLNMKWDGSRRYYNGYGYNSSHNISESNSSNSLERYLKFGSNSSSSEGDGLDGASVSSSSSNSSRALLEKFADVYMKVMVGRDQSQTESAMEDFRGVIEAETSWADVHSGEDENKERGNWTSRVEFFLACLGYAVGLGNIWRFPYLVYRNGGGAFFIPFVIMLLFIGVPLFYLELAFGQFASLGPITIWKVSPIFKGVGYAMVIVSSLVAIYYNVIIAWTLYYLFASMTADLPWAHCNNTWNTPLCSENAYSIQSNLTTTTTAAPTKSTPLSSVLTDSNLTSSLPNISSVNLAAFLASNTTQSPDTEVDIGETITTAITAVVNATLPQFRSPSEEYFSLHVLSKSEGIQDLGGMKWHILLCLTLAWILVFVCLIKGIKSSGKVVYFTATFPYILLFILFIRGVTLSGFEDGIRYYFTPQWEKLASAQVWKDAAVQIFFSLSTCWGGLITLASYNKFHNNCYRDAVIIALGNGATCVFAGLVIFAIMGVMAHEMGTTIDKVISEEVGLAFVIYPDAVLRMPVSPLWSILFFFMLLFVGLDTQFAIVETVSTAIADEFPHKFDNTKPRRKVLLILVLCLIYFFLGLPMCTQGGIYLMQLMDHYAASWSVLIIGICECVALSWVYGVDRFGADIKAMIGREPSFMWKCLWRLITPIIITFVLVFSLADYTAASYVEYSFPLWADIMGWMMALVSIVVIPVWAVYIICRAHGSLCERLRVVSHHTVDWGPALEQHRLFIAQLPRMYNYYLNALSEDSTTEFEGIQSSVELTVRSMREMLRNHQLAEQEKKRKASLSSVPAKRPSTKTRKTSPSGSSSTNKSDLITRDMPPEYQKAIEEGEMILVRKPKKPVPMEDKCIQTDPVSNGGLKNTPNGNVQGSSINNTTIGGDTVTASGEKILNSCLKKGGNSKKRRGRNIRVCKVEIESPTSEQVKDSSAFAVENEMSSLSPTRSKASSPRSNSHLLPSNKPQSSVPVTGTPSHHHSNSSLNSKHSETSTARPMEFHTGNGDSHEEHCPLSTKLDLSLNSSGDSVGANEQIHCLCNRKGSPRQAHFSIGNQPVAQSSRQTANSAASCDLDNNDDDDRFEETQM